MNRVKVCGGESHAQEAFAWSCFGIAWSALIAALTFPASVDFIKAIPGGGTQANLAAIVTEVACAILAISAFLLWWITLKHGSVCRKLAGDLRQLIIEDMQMLADRHVPQEAGGPTTTAPEPGASPTNPTAPR
jgi:hypothetical protein